MADTATPPVRPDAAPEDPNARPQNVFKQALNTFMYGSRDPSYVDVGEFRARGVFQHYAGEGQALAAGARPEVAASIYQAYAQQGAQAAQAMRERYYEKEHRQMIQTQIIPLKEQFDGVDAAYRAKIQIVNMPIPRTVTYEEGQARSIQAQMATPAPDEVVKMGKTAEGKDKTKVVAGTPGPEPNPAVGPQSMGAVEYTPETLAFMDPVTGQAVPITSFRGRQIEQDATNELMIAHNNLMTGMMDVFAQYPGNPFAVNSMQKIMDGVVNQAGKAVTGRADPYEQIKWKQEYDSKQADIAKRTTEANTSLLDLEVTEATLTAKANDAVQQAAQDPAFSQMLGKKAQNYIKKGVPVEEWDPKTRNEAAALGSSQRDLQQKDLASRRQAGLVRIEPKELGLQDTWHNRLQVRDEGYRHMLSQRYAQMQNKTMQDLVAIEGMPPAQQDATMDSLGVPADNTLRNLIRTGALSEDLVTTWLDGKLKGSSQYKTAQNQTYLDSLADITRQQPEVLQSIEGDNAEFINGWADYQLKHGADPADVQDKAEYMKADTLGTHMLATGQTDANGAYPDSYRPPAFKMKIDEEYIAPRAVAPEAPVVREEARQDMGLPPEVHAPEEVAPAEPPPVTVTPEQAIQAEPSGMSQEQLAASIELIKPYMREMEAASMDPTATPEQRSKATDAYRRLTLRMRELDQFHEGWLEKAGISAFKWLEDQGEARDKERLKMDKQTDALLRVVPKVN